MWQENKQLFHRAKLPLVVIGNVTDEVGFGGHCSSVWAELRKQYPEKMDPSKLEEVLKDDECLTKFLHDFQCKWKDESPRILT